MTHPYPPVTPARTASTGFLRSLSSAQKIGILLGGGALLFVMLCCGGVTLINAFSGGGEPGRSAAQNEQVPQAPAVERTTTPAVAPTTSAPKQETRTVTETQQIPFQTRYVNDSTLAKGTSKVRTQGVPGTKTLTYEVTLVDGVETAKRLLSEKVTKQPVTKVVLVGTKVSQNCHPSYTGACVPIASDVDCAGGDGDGPAYVRGPVRVVGPDVYDLDRDGNGIGCES